MAAYVPVHPTPAVPVPDCFGDYTNQRRSHCDGCAARRVCRLATSPSRAVAREMTVDPRLHPDKPASDGSTAHYYELPAGATELQDLISHRNMNAQDGEIFRAIYRKGHCPHSSLLREAKKTLFYAQAEVARLEKLERS